MVHPLAIISFESCEISKGHSVDRFSSELLDMSLQPLTFNWCFFFPRGLREKKLCSDFSVFSFNRFSYVGYIILFEEKWQLVLPQVQKVRLLLRDRSCVASFLPQSEIKNVCIEKHNIFTPFSLKEHTICT